ncbi:Coenzyme A biosynthesis bifunctional protein CoaBC OS=Streptomyces glaucescens OX=1907 GN=coaBC PE=3 SV=1 [Streptomyces glaucescens]
MDKPKVVLGVSGGIAAYKACELLRRLTESGHDVRVVPTASALHFVGAATWSALSGNPVSTEVWDDVHEVPHVRIGQHADLVVVAPATADMLAKAAHGLADDLLTNTLLTARCPVVFAPAMHTEMWEHPATQENVATLRRRGAVVIEPAVGRLTGVDTGEGRLPTPPRSSRSAAGSWPGACASPTSRAARRGQRRRHPRAARPGALPRQPLLRQAGVRPRPHGRRARRPGHAGRGQHRPAGPGRRGRGPGRHRGGTARGRAQAAADADAVVMAAAVADFRPAAYAAGKIKKKDGQEPDPIALVRNPDILAEISADRARPGQVIVGFAAETDDVLANGRAKLERKGCDLLVVNEVGERKTFGAEENEALVLAADGGETPVPHGPKEALAETVWDLVVARLG